MLDIFVNANALRAGAFGDLGDAYALAHKPSSCPWRNESTYYAAVGHHGLLLACSTLPARLG